MSEQAEAFRRLSHVVEAVEDEGGEVEDVDVTMRETGGLGSAMASFMGGRPPREPVFDLRVSASGVELDDGGEQEPEAEADEVNA